jgi:hypothetical protein
MAEYYITKQDYVDASYFALRMSRRLMYAVVLLVPLLIPFVVGFTAEILRLLGLIYAVLILFLLFLEPIIVCFLLRRIYRKNSIYHKPQDVSVFEDEITLNSETGSSRYKLTDLKKIERHKNIFLIYPASTFFHIIPDKILSDKEIHLLERNIP